MRKLFFFILFVSGFAFIVFCLERNPHDFNESQCVLCHKGDPSSSRSLIQGSPSVACSQCHADIFQSGFMHPVDIRPKTINVPGDFPLSFTGMITCNTCHSIHSAHTMESGEPSYFLRRLERGRAFCASCHTEQGLAAGSGHEQSLGEAHFQSEYISMGFGEELDATSKNCITCHDGAYASSVSINAGTWQHSGGMGSSRFSASKHPIGIDYEAARIKYGRKTDLRPISQVDKRLQFFDGRLGCGTCHNPYSSLENDLVMSNSRSALCFGCHAMN